MEYESKADVIAVQDWHHLSRKERREVARYARKGALHPSSAVAETSVSWAELVLRRSERKSAAAVAGVAFGLAVDWMLRSSGSSVLGGALGTVLRERMIARRIIRAKEKAGDPFAG